MMCIALPYGEIRKEILAGLSGPIKKGSFLLWYCSSYYLGYSSLMSVSGAKLRTLCGPVIAHI